MRVSATVLGAVTVESKSEVLKALPERQIGGELGSITLSGADSESILVTADSSLRLANGNGELIELPVEFKSQLAEEKLYFSFYTHQGRVKNKTKRNKGNYTGSLITRIEYM